MFLMCLNKSNYPHTFSTSGFHANSGFRMASKQSGSMIIISLFAIIVLTLLAGTLVSMISASSNSVLYEVYGVRAKNAAQAGIQELAMASFPLGAGPQLCDQVINSSASFAGIAGLQNCQFSARCTTTDINFNSEDYRHYRFTSTGSCAFDDLFVSRTLSVDAMQEH